MDITKRKCAEKSEKSSPIRFFATCSTDSKSASNFDTHIALKKFDHITLNANGDETTKKNEKQKFLIRFCDHQRPGRTKMVKSLYPTQAQRKQVEII
jgi:hypothetical protein